MLASGPPVVVPDALAVAFAVAATPGGLIVITGLVAYPPPAASMLMKATLPSLMVASNTVPVPPPPVTVTVGLEVYPLPPEVTITSTTWSAVFSTAMSVNSTAIRGSFWALRLKGAAKAKSAPAPKIRKIVFINEVNRFVGLLIYSVRCSLLGGRNRGDERI